MLGEMTASIAHEVSQPLMAISTDASAIQLWLDRAEPDIGEAREHTAHIVSSAARASDIIARVRGMAARRTPEPTMVSIDSVIEDALAFLSRELRANEVVVTLDLAPNLPAVRVDVTLLQQVVVNLTINAIQAMSQTEPARREFVVRALREDGMVTVTLEDAGPGIAADYLPGLFESFFTTKDGGMGMGLAICRTIIESHGGRISASNRAEGGAQFAFTLPAAPAPVDD
jgi:C4-dicarboxylate-specific signal transduction histidine kinase